MIIETQYEECKYCSEKFSEEHRTPIWIACGHILCRPCLILINFEEGQIVCPLCQPVRDHANGILHRKIDIRAIEDLTPHNDCLKYVVAKSQALCNEHTAPAVGFCLADTKFVCISCSSMHKAHEQSFNLLKIHSSLSKVLFKNCMSSSPIHLNKPQLHNAKEITETKNKLNDNMTKVRKILTSLEITVGGIKLPLSTLRELVFRYKALSNPNQLSVREKIEYLKYLKLLKADQSAIVKKLMKIVRDLQLML